MKLKLCLAVVAAAAACTTVTAQTVLSNPASVTWYRSRTSDTIAAGTNSVLFTEGQTSGSTFLMNFSNASVNVGSTLSLSLTFTTGSTLNGTTSNAFRFGLFNSGSTQISTSFNSNNAPSSAFADDLGYMVGYNFNGSSDADMRGRSGTLPNTLLSTTASPGWSSTLTSTGSGTKGAFQASTTYTLLFTLERTASGYNVSSTLNGGNYSNYYRTASDTSSDSKALSSFNEFAFYVNGGSGAVSSINITGMTISVIPEPSTYAALFGAAALGLVAYRRRRAAKAAA